MQYSEDSLVLELLAHKLLKSVHPVSSEGEWASQIGARKIQKEKTIASAQDMRIPRHTQRYAIRYHCTNWMQAFGAHIDIQRYSTRIAAC